MMDKHEPDPSASPMAELQRAGREIRAWRRVAAGGMLLFILVLVTVLLFQAR